MWYAVKRERHPLPGLRTHIYPQFKKARINASSKPQIAGTKDQSTGCNWLDRVDTRIRRCVDLRDPANNGARDNPNSNPHDHPHTNTYVNANLNTGTHTCAYCHLAATSGICCTRRRSLQLNCPHVRRIDPEHRQPEQPPSRLRNALCWHPLIDPLPHSHAHAVANRNPQCGRSDPTGMRYALLPGHGNDTLSSISANYNISVETIKNWNSLTSDIVYPGMFLNLPLCERMPTQGPTPTATLLPPYQAASLLLPADGAVFTNVNDAIVLQWSSVGTLFPTEAYAVTIEDVTAGDKRVVEYTTDTKFTVPTSLRPLDNTFHIFRWTVVAVRQSGTTSDGQPEYTVHGTVSAARVFGWSGSASVETPTP